MRAVIQRVLRASVSIDGAEHASIGAGLLVLLGVEGSDDASDIAWLAGKIVRLRIFPDQAGLMNRDVLEAGGEIMVVSQFTLFASTRKGNRPSFTRAAPPDLAVPRYESFLAELSQLTGRPVPAGRFGADMKVSLVNDGPVTLIIDTRQRE